MLGFLVHSSFAESRTLLIESPCSDELLLAVELDRRQETVGALTKRLLDGSGIPWLGSERSVLSINGSAYGDDALVLIDDRNLFAYGWCYEIDGAILDAMPDEFVLADHHREIRWFYGFAKYSSGEWLGYCESYSAPLPPLLCKD